MANYMDHHTLKMYICWHFQKLSQNDLLHYFPILHTHTKSVLRTKLSLHQYTQII